MGANVVDDARRVFGVPALWILRSSIVAYRIQGGLPMEWRGAAFTHIVPLGCFDS